MIMTTESNPRRLNILNFGPFRTIETYDRKCFTAATTSSSSSSSSSSSNSSNGSRMVVVVAAAAVFS